MRAFAGRAPEAGLALPLAHDARKKPGFSLLQKAALALGADGGLRVRLLQGQESFKTAPLLAARAWAVLPEDADLVAAGTLVRVFPLRPGEFPFDRQVP